MPEVCLIAQLFVDHAFDSFHRGCGVHLIGRAQPATRTNEKDRTFAARSSTVSANDLRNWSKRLSVNVMTASMSDPFAPRKTIMLNNGARDDRSDQGDIHARSEVREVSIDLLTQLRPSLCLRRSLFAQLVQATRVHV
jgi:hypothetical protein